MPNFEVVSFPASDHPRPGEVVADFTRPLVTVDGWRDATLSTIAAEGPIALFFYPLNWGGKSRYWWKAVRDRGWGEAGDGDGYRVLGVGIAQPFDQQRFAEFMDLPYGLFSDPANGVAERYDLVHDLDGMAGVSEPRPALFLLDESLTVEYAWVADGWPETPPYDEVEAAMASR